MPKTIAILGLLFLVSVLVSAPAGEAPLMIEVTLYVSGQFQSGVCRSPDVFSPAPYWSVNDNILNDKELNLLYGATVSRDYDGDGRYLATLSIPSLNLTLNDSRISCSVNMTVLLQYHLHLIDVEAELVYLPTEQYHSALCVSPSVTSPAAPYFIYNDVLLSNVEINKLYEANVTRSSSLKGHHQAVVVISALNSTLNDSTVTCMVNSTVIWKVRLIIESVPDVAIVPTIKGVLATMESNTTSDGIPHDQDVGVDTSKFNAKSTSSSAAWITIIALLVIVILAGNVGIAIYIRKRGECRRVYEPENMKSLPDDRIKQHPLLPSSESAVPQMHYDNETAITSRPVNGISQRSVVRKNEPVPSFSRDTDGNSIPGVTDTGVFDTSGSSCKPLNYSFEHLQIETQSEAPLPGIIPEIREEQCSSDHKGQSLAIACFNGNKNAYDPLTTAKCWQKFSGGTGSNRLCQYVLCGISDGNNSENDSSLA